LQGKSIKKQFKKPGNYTVKLTVEDEMGQKNSDTLNVYVESTPPSPQFSITPTNKRQYPSEFYLDAKASNDIDVSNGYDRLTYEWVFSNPNAVQTTSTEEKNKKITVLFNETGKHLVTLKVSDNYGKTEEITKEINVESILRPELTIRPKSAVW
jgi:PKD domain containing protein